MLGRGGEYMFKVAFERRVLIFGYQSASKESDRDKSGLVNQEQKRKRGNVLRLSTRESLEKSLALHSPKEQHPTRKTGPLLGNKK